MAEWIEDHCNNCDVPVQCGSRRPCDAKRIAELEADLRLSVRTSEELAKRITNLESRLIAISVEARENLRRAEAALERVRGLQEYPAHVFLPTETRSDGQRTRIPLKAKVVLASDLAAALKEEGK